MAYRNIIICDRCGAENPFTEDLAGWGRLQTPRLHSSSLKLSYDLCPPCWNFVQDVLKGNPK